MVSNIAVMASDAKNRYGFYILIQALESGILQRYEHGMPYLINHDSHRLIGWNQPFALFIEPQLSRQLSRTLLPETEEEINQVNFTYEQFRRTKYDDAEKRCEDNFKILLKENGIQDPLIVATNCVAHYQKGIATELFPSLFGLKDKEGLINLNQLLNDVTYMGQGVFKDKKSEFTLFTHQYFRRSQSIHNMPNGQFLDEFIALANNPDLDLYLCLDEDQVGFAPSFGDYMELEFVYGPTYTDDIASIKPGLNKHQNKDRDRRMSGISNTEVLWEWDKHLYTFQLEEISDLEAPMEEQSVFHCRYIHSIFNNEIKDFDHFDGAIRTYPFEDMVERTSKNFKEYGKKSTYKKLFKVNRKLSIAKWKSLVTLFLRGNRLIYEYFGLKAEIDQLRPAKNTEPDPIETLVPFAIEPEDGLKMLVSYFPQKDFPHGRFIDSFDLMSDNVGQHKCVDFSVLELKKSLQKLGDDLSIPDDVLFIKCEDRYLNIPSILHTGPRAADLLANTVTALKLLLDKIISRGLNLDISITLGQPVSGKIIKVSAFGNCKVLHKWLTNSMPFPSNQEQFSEWLTEQKIYLNQFRNSGKDSYLDTLVQMDGVLYAKRNSVNYPYEFELKDEGLGYRVKLPAMEEALLSSGQIKIVTTMIVEKCECIDTGEDYFISSRSKWLDDDLPGVAITQASPLALYWSI